MRKRYVIVLLVSIIILTAFIGIKRTVSTSKENLENLAALKIENTDLTKLPNGVYYGEYNVFPVGAQVNVTISEGKISNIQLIKHTNGRGKAAEIITDKVVKTQNLNVDVISGATYSSKVILKAIENALNKSNQ